MFGWQTKEDLPSLTYRPSFEKDTSLDDATLWKICTGAPVAVSHSPTVLPSDADARSLPSGENVTPLTPDVCPSNACTSAPVAVSHSLAVLSSDADARSLPSAENATFQIQD